MNIYIIIPMLLLLSTAACSNCNNIKGSYSTSGGSESMTYLNLLKDSKYILKHDVWEPAAYDKKETYITKGTWSCSEGNITLHITKSSYNAKLHVIGKNPLLINKNTMVIHFDPISDKINYNLSNKIFYPVSSLGE
jgi:hypothetical protein